MTQAAPTAPRKTPPRQDRLRRAFFRGEALHLGDAEYLNFARTLLNLLLTCDIGAGDLTITALEVSDEHSRAKILAKEAGVIAGMAEFSWLLGRNDLEVNIFKRDGDPIEPGDAVAEIEGRRNDLLAHERIGLNVLQRLSGIATAARDFQRLAHRNNPEAQVIGTRKTPWGLLDKRALYLGGAGTHRLGLWDAILVKNNHLALLGKDEEEAVEIAVERTWPFRKSAVFIEVEVRTLKGAVQAAEAFRRKRHSSQEETDADYPCVLLLDNMAPPRIAETISELRARNLIEQVLTEASGNISECNLEEYAASGVDAISMGALTHSARALDICERLQAKGQEHDPVG